jgi:hypothetical protein
MVLSALSHALEMLGAVAGCGSVADYGTGFDSKLLLLNNWVWPGCSSFDVLVSYTRLWFVDLNLTTRRRPMWRKLDGLFF